MKKALAIIPARGGSKGIFRKNLQEVGGVPLVQRTIETAQNCKQISRVIVSTDDEEIATIAKQCKAITIRRPPELANDTAKSEDALLHTIRMMQEQGAVEENIVFLQCTSPFTRPEDIEVVLNALDSYKYNSSFAATSWHGFLWSQEGIGINHNPLEERKRRQDLQRTLLETGSVYAMKTNQFLVKKTRFCPPTKPVEVGHNPIEIDSEEDLSLCRIIQKTQMTHEI